MARRGVTVLLAAVLVVGCGITVAPPPDEHPSSALAATPSGGSSASLEATPTPGPTVQPSASVGPTTTPGPSASPTPGTSATPTPVPATFPSTIGPELDAGLQAEVGRVRESLGVPGVSVAVRLANGETWTAVSGVTSVDDQKAVDRETVFAVASITKTFVAALILRLAEEGELSLDDPLSDYLPAFPGAASISIRQLLSHTSGVHDFFASSRYHRALHADLERAFRFDEIVDLVMGAYCAPGACFRYSNTNYVLLGRVAEVVTGRPVSALIRNRLLDPVGLGHTFFQPDERTPANAAHAHLFEPDPTVLSDLTADGEVIPHMSAVTLAWAAGAMASTPSDLTAWASALYGGQVLEPASLAQMLDFPRRYRYGLGTYAFVLQDRPAVGHTGGIHGFVSVVAYFPADGVSIAMTANRGQTSPFRVVNRVLAVLLGHRTPRV